MYDFLVVGAGSAGAVIASRLTEDPTVRVLLLEAAGPRIPKESRIPAAFARLFKTEYDWNFETEPEPELGNRRLYWPRGKLMGGSSAMNAMIWTPGVRADFDRWATLGNPGWSYQEIAPLFEAATRRSSRPPIGIAVSPLRTVSPVTQAMLSAALASNLPANHGFQDGNLIGAGLFRVTQAGGARVSAAAGYLEPVRARPNLTIRPGAVVDRVVLEGRRAVGVVARDGETGSTKEVHGRVVLAAGAIGSPELLLRSGIGPASELESAGVRARHELPGVGKNLQDHLSIGRMWQCREPATLASAERIDNLLRYLLFRRGPLSSNVAEAGAFVRLEPRDEQSTIELIFAPSFFVNHGFENPEGHGYTIAAILQHPESRGELRLGPTPGALPVIRANYLAHPIDLERLVSGLELAGSIGERPELARYRGEEILPGRGRDLEAFVRHHSETLYHPAGTCAMGSGPMAVVDHRLAVRGIEDLWVSDASIMPVITTGHPHAAVVMIGERAARLLVE
jgi:choline dehydrogenase